MGARLSSALVGWVFAIARNDPARAVTYLEKASASALPETAWLLGDATDARDDAAAREAYDRVVSGAAEATSSRWPFYAATEPRPG
jgi:hypothetical protein